MGQTVLIYIDAQLAELQEFQPIHWYLHKNHGVHSKRHTHTHSKVTAVSKKKNKKLLFSLLSNRKWLRHKCINMDKNLHKTDNVLKFIFSFMLIQFHS